MADRPPADPAPRAIALRQPTPGAMNNVDRALIERVVHRFYERVRDDAMLGPIFAVRIEQTRWPAHLATMVEFWSSVLLLTGSYKGKPVPAHMPLRLEDHHFRRWLALFRNVVEELCAPDGAALFMDRATRIAESLRMAAIQIQPGGAPVFLAPLSQEFRA